MPSQFEALICTKRIDETANASTFEFKKLNDALFEYKAGQFMTLQVEVAGELEYRAYSLSSTPSQPESITLTIKRVVGGKVSNYLLDHLQPGIALPAMAASGTFTIEDNLVTPDIIFMSAGSGMTPCISMARWLLDTNKKVNIHFIYSAHNEEDIIMDETLMMLSQTHENFRLSVLLTAPHHNRFIKGRLTADNFSTLVGDTSAKTLFTCGPAGYMDLVETLAMQQGIDRDLFYKESFVAETPTELIENDNAVNYQAVVPQYAKNITLTANQTLLAALEAADVPIIGACRTGVCGACKCKVTGNVESSSQATLSVEQIEQGYVLSCSSKATSDLLIEL